MNTLRFNYLFCNLALLCLPLLLFSSPAAITFTQTGPFRFENYTLESGLSSNVVHCFYQDTRGLMWIGTSQGLNRFDGYKFTVYRPDANDNQSLSAPLVRVIFEDSKNNLWVGTENGGLNRFNRDNETFVRYSNRENFSSLFGSSVNAIVEDKAGNLWIGTEKGLSKINPATGKVLAYFNQGQDGRSLANNYIRVLKFDKSGKLWIGSNGGLDCLDMRTTSFQHVALSFGKRMDDDVYQIFEDTDGKLWIGTYNSGIFMVDAQKYEYKHLDIDADNERSLTVRSITRDTQGLYWIGTRGGLYLYSKESKSFTLMVHDDREPNSLCHSSVLNVYNDAKGDVWIGTRGGISYLIKDKQIFKHYKAFQSEVKYLNDNEIWTFWIDPEGKIWIGTERGGINILDRKKGIFTYLQHDAKNSNSISRNCIKALMDDKAGNLWIGTFMGGIDILQLKTGRMRHFTHNDSPGSLSDNRIYSLFRDSKGEIWVGTVKGLDRFDPAGGKFASCNDLSGNQSVFWINEDSSHCLWVGGEDELVVYDVATGKTNRFKERTRGLCQDSKGRIWITTITKGLALFDKNKGALKYYNEKSGVANNQTLCILEDDNQCLWISTDNGLTRFNPDKNLFHNFNKQDGLQNNQFLYGASYKSNTGELLFGGINGFNIFDPRKVKENNYVPPIVFTDFRIFNKPVPVGDATFLKQCISETKEIILPFNQNVISIEFAALNFTQSNKNKYRYILEGFEKSWNDAGIQRLVTYTNLNPGNYIFKVKASNNDNVWNEKGISLAITILPPIWKTWWFKLCIIIVIFVGIYLLILFLTIRTRLRHELVFERMRAKEMHDLDMMKLRFFTNISHEIRTPLTLILGPLEKMLNQEVSGHETKNYLSIMHRNAKQLLKLINQLLDYRKLEAGSLRLELSRGDIISFARDTVLSFTSLANEKEINLKFSSAEKELFMLFDPDKVEKILNNLLSNAIKFTQKDGTVSVKISLTTGVDEANESNTGNKKFIEILVKDSGVGIPSSNLNKVFVRFFQGVDGQNNTGTGIGLALTRELVKIHDGHIFVTSKPGKGSQFTVRLPLEMEKRAESSSEKMDSGNSSESLEDPKVIPETDDAVAPQRILLIVEDNADVRYFIHTQFDVDFQVVESVDGKDGWNQALKLIPDIIISDVMMPEMNGRDLCKKIKKDERTSHIPIILLTALASKEHELEGLVAGADDYIMKPFDISILRTKVENLLAVRQSFKEKYTGELVLKPKNITISSPDERFLQRVIEVVEKNIDDPDLDIEKFATAIGVSRMQLYRKLDALTDMTVKEFIRNIRLKRAAQLLEQKKLTVSEVAYAVGFKDLSHFRKCFKQQFGMNASEYNERQNV
jgi:ligand-binding sensor domain-containing protein/signal transduction histidine kinase/DNA-binding response OmpR family regulator